MNKILKTAFLLGGLSLLFTSPAQAKDLGDSVWSKEHFQFRLRGIGVLPDSGGDTTIGGTPSVEDAYVPEIDITYFLTQNVALELIAATSSHDLDLDNSTLGNLDLGDTMILPPTLTLQYHFSPDAQFSPYLGAGINYTLPYSEDADGGTVTQLEADGSFGVALQAGADFWINENWGINFDVKKVWVDVDASINNGAITGELVLDPWIIGTGVSYRF